MAVPERVLIAGAGPIGLACAISGRRRGFDPLVIDAGAIADSIVRYPVGMVFFTTPERLEIGSHPLVCAGPKATREEALKYYRGVVRAEGLLVRAYARLAGAERRDGGIVCRVTTRLGEERITCDRLVLATGYFDHPNPLHVPGGDPPPASPPSSGRAARWWWGAQRPRRWSGPPPPTGPPPGCPWSPGAPRSSRASSTGSS